MPDSRSPILLCYDGSADAERAVNSAGTLFPGRPAIVLYVSSDVAAGRVRTTSVEIVREELIEEVRVAARREARAVAEEGTRLAREAGLEARPLTTEAADGIADAIVRIASTESAAAVVVGRPSRTGLGALVTGGVARKVLDHCPVPVVLA